MERIQLLRCENPLPAERKPRVTGGRAFTGAHCISGIHIPLEILRLVFEHAMGGDLAAWPPNGPLRYNMLRTLTQVCSYWRTSAIRFASLWTTVDFGNPRVSQMFINRSRRALLDVYIPGSTFWKSNVGFSMERVKPLIPRIRRLHATCSYLRELRPLLLEKQPANSLTHLFVSCTDEVQGRNLPMLFGGKVSALVSVTLSGFRSCGDNRFSTLKHLSLQCVDDIRTRELLDILEANPTLETLELVNSKAIVDQTDRQISLPNLQRMECSAGIPLDLFDLLSFPPSCNTKLLEDTKLKDTSALDLQLFDGFTNMRIARDVPHGGIVCPSCPACDERRVEICAGVRQSSCYNLGALRPQMIRWFPRKAV